MNFMLKTFARGFIIGVANIIPGVSGGTMALVLGIYERIIRAIHSIDKQTLRCLLHLAMFRKSAWTDLRLEWKRLDGSFLAWLATGAIAAILSTARLMAYLLDQHHAPTYAFFLGLVLISMIFPYRYIRRKSAIQLVTFLVAAALVVSLSFLSDDDAEIHKARVKQDLAAEQGAAVTGIEAGERPSRPLVSLAWPGAKRAGFIFIAAGIAISAMVLPGISGSFILLLMGVYFDVLLAINNRELVVLALFGGGCVVGLLLFARIMNLLLARFYDMTMAFMLGLMAGSLYFLWPFKRVVEVGTETLYLSNIWPRGMENGSLLTVATAFLAGSAIVGAFVVFENKGPSNTKPAPTGA